MSSRRTSSTRSAPAFRARDSISIRPCWRTFPVQPRFRQRRRPGRNRRRRRRHHHRPLRHHLGRPEQRRRRLESPQSFHLSPTMCRSPRASIRSAPASGSSACRTTKTPPRASLAGHVHQPDDVPARNRQQLSSGARPPTNWAGAVCSAPGMSRTPSSCGRNLTLQVGLRHEFTTGWNEAFGRAANYITDANGVLETAPRVGNSVFTQNNAKQLFGPRVGLAWDPFGNGKTPSARASAPTIR